MKPTPAQANRQGMPNVQYEYVNGKWRIKKKGGGGAGAGPAAAPFNMNKWLQSQAQRLVNAEIAAIQKSQDLYLAELNRLSQTRVKEGQALAAWMQGQNFPGRVQDIYRTAGSDITGYASGFGGEIKGIAESDAAQVNNMLSGTGQEARNEGQGMSDVFYGAYGWSPARKFAETGAAYAADAALQPSFAARFAQEDAYKMHQEGLAGLKDFALQMAEARMGKSKHVADLRAQMNAEKEARFKKFLQLAAIADAKGDDKARDKYIAMAMGDNRLAARKQRIAELASRGYAPDGKTPLPGYHIDPTTGRPIENGWKVNPKTGEPVKVQDPKDKDKPKPADWGKINKEMANEKLIIEIPGKIIDGIQNEPIKRLMTYEEARAWLYAKYQAYVKDKARLKALIHRILLARGLKPKGQK